MNKSVLLCGVGGQGTVLASKLLAAAAMAKGMLVMTAETIGMAQRGGSVFSHLRMGDDIYSPLIGKGQADIILGFEPAEAVRMLPYLKPDGVVVVSRRAIMPVTAALSGSDYSSEPMIVYLEQKVSRVITIDSDQAFADLGSGKVLNMVLLGAAIDSGVLGISKDEIRDAIRHKVPERFHALNYKALDYASQNQ